ncbi:ABC transporter permease, partial [Streptomyces sp. NPDC006356]
MNQPHTPAREPDRPPDQQTAAAATVPTTMRKSKVPPYARHSRTPTPAPTTARNALLRWLVLAVAVAVWQLATRAHGSVYFPPPAEIAGHAHDLWFSGPAGHLFLTEAAVADILPSLGRMAAGFGIAAVAGIALGV